MDVCPVKKFLDSPKEYYIEQITTGCLSQFAYYIESNGEAAVIDPMRDTDNILSLLKIRNAKLKYIMETHFHADFVSGHCDLAQRTGADIIYGPCAVAQYKIITAQDEQIFQIGDIKIKVIHTPGHTMESSCFVIIDKSGKETAVFTGDTIFLGDVGRPDLAVKTDMSEKDLAGFLFNSIQRIKKLPDETIIFPGHGAGSACGKSIQIGMGDSLKGQKEKNFAFKDSLTIDEFIQLATSNLPMPPKYFFFDAKMNMEGYENIDSLLKKSFKALSYEDFERISKENNVVIIDSRDAADSTKGFIKGSYLIPLNINYAIWSAILLKPDHKILIIAKPTTEKESIVRLFRVGYYNIMGYLDGGIEIYAKKNPTNIATLTKIDYDEGKKMIDHDKINLLDVREINEYENTGVIEKSNLYPLSELEKKVEELKNTQKPLGIYCKTGARATIASSILTKFNINNFYWLGTFNGLAEKGAKVIKYIKK